MASEDEIARGNATKEEKWVTEWDQILREERYSVEEPDEVVIGFAALLEKKKAKSRVLDLGCGGGRHQVYLAKLGFEAHGADISETGLRLTEERLKRRKLAVYLVKCDMNHLPYVSSCFDAVVSLHTVYHQKLSGVQEAISEIHRVSKKGGSVLVNFLSKRTYKYGKGVRVEKDTFIEHDGSEKGVVHHFTDRREIKKLFGDFESVKIELRERTSPDGHRQSRWIVMGTV